MRVLRLAAFALVLIACSPGPDGTGLDATGPRTMSPTPVATPLPATRPVVGPLRFTASLVADTPLSAPYGIDVDGSGHVYVFDAGNDRVVVFDSDGDQVGEWGGTGTQPGRFASLGFGALAVGDDDLVYVVDNGNHRVQVFDTDGTPVRTFGQAGTGPGSLDRAIGIDVVGDRVVVTDDARPLVQVFTTEGTPVAELGADADLVHPTGVVATEESTFVADYEARKVVQLDLEGNLVGTWQLPGPAGSAEIPEGLAVDAAGRLLVTGYRSGTVFGLPAEPGLEGPWDVLVDRGTTEDPAMRLSAPVDIAVTADGVVYVTDQRRNLVNRYEVG